MDKTLASKVASPYAEALLDFAKRGKSFDEMNQDINVISQFISSSKDLERFLANPVVTNESKKTVLVLNT
jgi:F0F1-type ATP synthase delta subunit